MTDLTSTYLDPAENNQGGPVWSPDNRAVQTARIAFEGSGIPTHLDWRLRECNYGGGRFLRELKASRGGQRVLLIGHLASHWALDHYVRGLSLEELVDAPFHWQEGWEYVLRSSPST